jgi:23S rRNA (pseudouridine1915-N3)-methyltransferase
MKIHVICVGKPASFTREWLAEYEKRLTKYASVDWIEIKESNPQQEAKEILAKVDNAKEKGVVVLLDINGKSLASEQFAEWLRKTTMQSDIIFIIGGASGVTEDVRTRASMRLSFGSMTLPHQLARLVLAEQIYRAFTIIKGEPYHK